MDYFIGWDVGAWKCGKGKDDSCDAIVVLDDSGIVGFLRSNLGSSIQEIIATDAVDRPKVLIEQWFSLCIGKIKGKGYSKDDQYYIAIDTPLGWPSDFKVLLNETVPECWDHNPKSANINNTLLYRHTERKVLKNAMSVIVHNIGSQSTKGMILRQLLGAEDKEWGIWKAGNITLFETYPKACLVRADFVDWISSLKLEHSLSQKFTETSKDPVSKKKQSHTVNLITGDVFDASVCACVAKAFAEGSPNLIRPTNTDPDKYKPEGWIFYPEPDTFISPKVANGHIQATSKDGVTTFHQAIGNFKGYVEARLKEEKKKAKKNNNANHTFIPHRTEQPIP